MTARPQIGLFIYLYDLQHPFLNCQIPNLHNGISDMALRDTQLAL